MPQIIYAASLAIRQRHAYVAVSFVQRRVESISAAESYATLTFQMTDPKRLHRASIGTSRDRFIPRKPLWCSNPGHSDAYWCVSPVVVVDSAAAGSVAAAGSPAAGSAGLAAASAAAGSAVAEMAAAAAKAAAGSAAAAREAGGSAVTNADRSYHRSSMYRNRRSGFDPPPFLQDMPLCWARCF